MRILLVICCLNLLTACGGGGSGEANNPSPTPPNNADLTPPAAPSLSLTDNQDGTLSISGSAEANSTVSIILPDGTTLSTTSTQEANFGPINSAVPQANGAVSVTATDSAGNTSSQTQESYIDNNPPITPSQLITVNSNGTLTISGDAEVNSSVSVTFPDGTVGSVITSAQGSYGGLTSALPQTSGLISTNAIDINGNSSTTVSESYVDTIAPIIPSVNVVVNDNNTLSVDGIAEAGSQITIYFDDGSISTTIALTNRLFGPVSSAAPQFTGIVEVTSTDEAGNVSGTNQTAYAVTPENALWELVSNSHAKDIVRFLTQSTFGPTEQEIQRLVATDSNYENWLSHQFEVEPTNLLNKFDDRLREAGLPVNSRANLDFAYHKQLVASDMLWDTFANGDDQLRQRIAFALSQIFVVSETSDTLFNNARGVVAYHDLLASHAFGNYRDLIEAVTLNPIMGEYLSMIRNEKANDQENIRPDENYARELMQLFSIGLVMLNPDGSLQLDENSQPIPTYNQDIIKAFARIFTGWTYGNATFWNFDGWLFGDTVNSMKAFEALHDTDEKTLLNDSVLPAGQTAYEDLQGALDNLFNHPNVPPFIGKQLIQRLVTSNPSPEYIERISEVFIDNGDGVRGDLGAVVSAILLDEEARSGHLENPTRFGKLKEPVLKFTALIRAFDVEASHPINSAGLLRPTLRFYWASAASGQRPYGSPSVFNFFRPDHSPAGPIRNAGLVAPELQILNESFITEATNYGSAVIFNSYDFLLDDCEQRIGHLDGFGCPYSNFEQEKALADNVDHLLSRLNLLMLAGEMSVVTQDALAVLAEQQTEPRFVVAEVVHLLYISPEFAVQR